MTFSFLEPDKLAEAQVAFDCERAARDCTFAGRHLEAAALSMQAFALWKRIVGQDIIIARRVV